MSPRRKKAPAPPKLSLEHRRKISDAKRQVSDADRFWTLVAAPDDAGCMRWLGKIKKGRRSNAGDFRLGSRVDGTRRMVAAHVYSYELAKGAIPAGLVVRHSCDVPICVNPEHLELGSQLDNVRDMIERGRAGWQRAAAGGAS